MNDLFDLLTIENLEGNSRELADVIGIEPFKNLVRYYGGSQDLYVPVKDSLTIPIRNDLIYKEYEAGATVRQLAAKWGLSCRYIYEIVKGNV